MRGPDHLLAATVGDSHCRTGSTRSNFIRSKAPAQASSTRHPAKLRGGNSGFAFIGHYSGAGDAIQVKVSTQRHNDDPSFKPLFGPDMITLTLRGRQNGSMVDFEGTALQLPGVTFTAILTRISDQRVIRSRARRLSRRIGQAVGLDDRAQTDIPGPEVRTSAVWACFRRSRCNRSAARPLPS